MDWMRSEAYIFILREDGIVTEKGRGMLILNVEGFNFVTSKTKMGRIR